MNKLIIIVFGVFVGVRLVTLFISIRNEKRLKRAGAQEYGRLNSRILALLHIAFYVSAFAEGYVKQVQVDYLTYFGGLIGAFALVMLLCVIQQLGPLWTVKLIIAPEHPLNQSFLFRYFRHPNYFLNLIPELVGLALVLKACMVQMVLFPIYMISLMVRISQEEQVMCVKFEDY